MFVYLKSSLTLPKLNWYGETTKATTNGKEKHDILSKERNANVFGKEDTTTGKILSKKGVLSKK